MATGGKKIKKRKIKKRGVTSSSKQSCFGNKIERKKKRTTKSVRKSTKSLKKKQLYMSIIKGYIKNEIIVLTN